MKINIKATNIELTDAIRDYVNRRLENIQKFVDEGGEKFIYVEVAKTTNHHKQGDFFKAEFNVNINEETYFTVSEEEDLYAAIDLAKDELLQRIIDTKKRKKTLFRRGAQKVKEIMKGLSKHNPFN